MINLTVSSLMFLIHVIQHMRIISSIRLTLAAAHTSWSNFRASCIRKLNQIINSFEICIGVFSGFRIPYQCPMSSVCPSLWPQWCFLPRCLLCGISFWSIAEESESDDSSELELPAGPCVIGGVVEDGTVMGSPGVVEDGTVMGSPGVID